MPDPERSLRSLATRDDLFPDTPDIAADIAGRIGRSRPPRWTGWRMAAILALAVLAALAAALAVPRSRSAIADFFGIEGIRIERADGDGPAVPATPVSIGGSLLLGERTTLADATGAAPFEIMLPAASAAGAPDEIWLNRRAGTTVVGLIWPAGDDLPEIGGTGVGMLLLEIESDDDDVMIIKKSVAGGVFDSAMVGDWPGYWIEQGILTVAPVEGLMPGLPQPPPRRSGHVLIWSDGEITYRLETALPRSDAVHIAESLAPARDAGSP